MKFNPTPWQKNSERTWSNHREAAARKAIARDVAKIEAAKQRDADTVALFPELQDPKIQSAQPRHTTTTERRDWAHARETRLIRFWRATRARSWREARALYFSLPSIRRAGAKRLWEHGQYPHDPAYLATMCRGFLLSGTNPWTYLRKLHLIVLWREGKVPRPPYFREMVRNMSSI